MLKRYASPLMKSTDNKYLSVQIVEIQDGVVVRSYPFEAELASTTWLEGMIEINKENGETRAYLLSPFDCINKQPVDGTQRTLLK